MHGNHRSARWRDFQKALLGCAAVCLQVLAGPPAAAQETPRGPVVYIGTGGPREGPALFAARLDTETGHLTSLGVAAQIPQPNWSVYDPKRSILYTASELGDDGKSPGYIHSSSVDRKTGALKDLGKVAVGGGVTYVTRDEKLNTLFSGSYGDAQVAALAIQSDGTLASPASVQKETGSGPSPRQASAHTHGVTVDPTKRWVLTADMGNDHVFVYRFDASTRALTPGPAPSVAFPAGAGPRHLVFTANGRYAFVNTELSADIHSFSWNAKDGTLTPLEITHMSSPGFTGMKNSAEMALSADGRFLYLSSRSENSLIVYSVDQNAGKLSEIQRTGAVGNFPWSFSIDPTGRWMLVANERSNTVNVLKVDRSTGLLSPTAEAIEVPTPVAVTFGPD